MIGYGSETSPSHPSESYTNDRFFSFKAEDFYLNYSVKGRSIFLIKFFFFSDLEPTERVKLIENRLIVCQLRQEYLDSQKYENLPRDPYQYSACNRAKLMLNTEMQWLRE
ncbi:MAG: hypothetical protein F6K48_06895 [Okeania sp. SIO3H1]|uniref:hypothetical protein n=1 Tax=Okeania sp. SIO1I7 TaxID=2607772 RepID=UPI0013CD5680|nr:hypothetical protein [Okeania sp. SIO1I7]NEN88660.1 hypothetical protein [Okeania sp. SIO3H1]NET27820.1 hypothetical protein [Okeania sp. SIO1I7]